MDWLLSQYKVIDLPNYGNAHIIDIGLKEREVLIFATVLSPFDVIHVPNIKYFQDRFRVVIYRRKESKTTPITPVERAVSSELAVSLSTVKSHIGNINRKLNVKSRKQLVEKLENHTWD